MDLFCYCYNILFVLLFTAALSVCFMTYGMTKNRVFLRFGEVFFAYILEAIFLAIVELFAAFDLGVSGGAPELICRLLLVLFSAVEVYLTGAAVWAMFDRQDRGALCGLSLAVALISLLGLLRPGDAAETVSMSMFNVGILAVCGLYRLLRKKHGQQEEDYRGLMGTMGAFALLAILEHILYMFPLRAWMDEIFPFYGRQICFADDLFSLVLVIWLFVFAGKERERAVARQIEENLQHRMNEFEAQRQEKSRQVKQEQVREFCQHYHLTERETEILRLVLDGKSNQEISEELYITVGTVKAHIHSIFGKLEISRRSQLMMQFVNHGAK